MRRCFASNPGGYVRGCPAILTRINLGDGGTHRTHTSTRRFLSRPSSVLLSPTGMADEKPVTSTSTLKLEVLARMHYLVDLLIQFRCFIQVKKHRPYRFRS